MDSGGGYHRWWGGRLRIRRRRGFGGDGCRGRLGRRGGGRERRRGEGRGCCIGGRSSGDVMEEGGVIGPFHGGGLEAARITTVRRGFCERRG